jgi:hypothetical protein
MGAGKQSKRECKLLVKQLQDALVISSGLQQVPRTTVVRGS